MPRPLHLVLAFAALLIAAFVVVRPDAFAVTEVRIQGVDRARPAELRHLADVPHGLSMWAVHPEDVARRVAAHPWVDQAQVRWRPPGRIDVEVTERAPVALLVYGGALYLVDAAGVPFHRAEADSLDQPLLTGITPELDARHDALARHAILDGLWLLDTLDAEGLVPRDRVSEVFFHPLDGFTVRLTGGTAERPAAEVHFALGGFERQVRRLKALVEHEPPVDLDASVRVELGAERVALVEPLVDLPEVAP